jgi:hypothetical protein
LASLWLDRPELRELITAASRKLDRQLRRDPLECGESRESNKRIAHAPPLGIRFVVQSDDRIVKVLSIWLCLPRSAR